MHINVRQCRAITIYLAQSIAFGKLVVFVLHIDTLSQMIIRTPFVVISVSSSKFCGAQQFIIM